MDPGVSILIVDDSTAALEIFTEQFLEKGFHKAMGAVSGKEIKSLLKEKRPDVILLNAGIRGEDYIKILKDVRSVDRLIPVMLLIDGEGKEIVENALKSGASSCIINTAAVSDIADNIKTMLDKQASVKTESRPGILIIDDSKDVSNVARGILESDGYECLVINEARKAVDAVKRYKPKLIFLDIIMPDIDGIELLQEIKKIDSGIKVVMVSGVVDNEICIEAVKKGASGYITKPFSPEQLKTTVVSALIEK
ncbi:MAG: response regulator [Candidatus Omnitrophota bacterium]